ncbi:hypothetical protein [Aeromonas caviae]|uniref:hypothetical protein n=1 Tax=Aeromonas caviae TaxID=648 RepID=UPI00385B2507
MKDAKVLADMARQIKSMKQELLRMVKQKASSDLANTQTQALKGIEDLFNEIKKTKERYDSLGGAYSLGFFRFPPEALKADRMIKPTMIAMRNNGKVAVEHEDDGLKVYVLNNGNAEEIMDKIVRITAIDAQAFNKHELAVSDLLQNNNNLAFSL